MVGRALISATVTLLISCLGADQALAQATNLEAGKTPSQLFAQTCNACHKSPRGLLKTVAPGSLPGFLRQHYTTSPDMANVLSSYLVSNGATDTRLGGGDQAKGAKESPRDRVKDERAKEGAREVRQEPQPSPPEQLDRFGRRQQPAATQEPARPEEPRQAARPEEGAAPQNEPAPRPGRNTRRLARPAEAPDGAKPDIDGSMPAQSATGDGRRPSKPKLSKRAKPNEEPPKTDSARGKADTAKEEPAAEPRPELRSEPKPEPKSESQPESKGGGAKVDMGKPEESKSAAEPPAQSTRVETPKESSETPALRPDPVPPVAPASAPPAASAPPSAAEPARAPAGTAASSAPATGVAEPTTKTSEPAAPAPPPPVAATAPPPAAGPAGPPLPPISR